ncbi:MAG: hypothetical protein ABXS92_05110 [Sulfurimonas sp.]
MLKFLYVLSALYGLWLFSLFFENSYISLSDMAPILGAIGIILSAFIASFTLQKSIQNDRKKQIKKFHEKLDMSFYMLDKNKENIRLLEQFVKTDNPMFHKASILDVLSLSLKNLSKLEDQITVSPVSIARMESYIISMKFIIEKLPEERAIQLTKEFIEMLRNFQSVTQSSDDQLRKDHCNNKTT